MWGELQKNSANRSIGGPVGRQAPAIFAGSFQVPLVRDGDVIMVEDALEGLRGLAAPSEPKDGAIANVTLGAEPTPLKATFAGLGSQPVALGAPSDPEAVQRWVEADEKEARQQGAALSEARRQERLARADARKAELQEMRDADREAAELTS